MRRGVIVLAALTLVTMLTLQAGEAWARAGSGGSRGSRSSSAPARPTPMSPTTPSTPSRSFNSPPTTAPAPSRSWFGPIMGGLAGFALGGLLGSMLMGHGWGGGIGLLDLVLIGGALFLLFRLMSARRQPEPAYAGAPYAGGTRGEFDSAQSPGPTTPVVDSDLDRGLGHIRSMDPSFDPGLVADEARRLFADVQHAVT